MFGFSLKFLREIISTNNLLIDTVFCVQVCRYVSTLIHFVVCLASGPQPLPNRILHALPSSASSFNFQYPLVSLRSSSSCLQLLPRLHFTSVFPSVRCFRRQFVPKMWPIQLVFLIFIMSDVPLSPYSIQIFISHASVQMIFSVLL
jgi:hypothetical protein